jgi:hypothetical protein
VPAERDVIGWFSVQHEKNRLQLLESKVMDQQLLKGCASQHQVKTQLQVLGDATAGSECFL